ncbi:MAG: S8 family serine peptidase [Alphaproteobacteria bacterium]
MPILLALLAAPLSPPDGRPWMSGVAWADDHDDDEGDDDDDDDEGDDDDDDGGSSPTRAGDDQPAPIPPPPTAAPAEIVAFDLSAADYEALLAQGYELIDEQTIAAFGSTLRRLRVPPGISLIDARAAVRALPSGQDADLNHYYRPEQTGEVSCAGLHCPALDLIDWPLDPSRENACGEDIPIGMIDTAVNTDHPTFAGSRLEFRRLMDDAPATSDATHGTAIAAILVGDPASRSPGLLPHARLVAVDAFSRVRSDERADVFTLVEALGFLAGENVRVINLSLAGPPNTVLERAVSELAGPLGIVLVAAAGNAGPQAGPLYPAAYDGVVAVTAVDQAGTVYRRAGRGPHIDFAAPGVDVWTAASVSGARARTGTSFAAPFVSAAAVLVLQEAPGLTPERVLDVLSATARDLGAAGRDEIYGHGLLSLTGLCQTAKPLPAGTVD